MQDFFTAVFYQPLFNALIFIYNLLPTHDLGLAIILLTVVVRLALAPLTWKQIKSQHELQVIQPKIEALKEKYGTDREALARAQMQLFAEHKINPLASCFPILVQFPILLALFWVFHNGLEAKSFELLYPFVTRPDVLNHTFLGLMSVSENHNIVLALLNGVFQYIQISMMMQKRDPSAAKTKADEFAIMMNRQMRVMLPIFIAVLSFQYASGLGLYWLSQTILSAGQQAIFFRKKTQAN